MGDADQYCQQMQQRPQNWKGELKHKLQIQSEDSIWKIQSIR